MSNQSKGSGGGSETSNLLAYSAFMGMLRSLAGFPIEQPMESVKTQWQANPAKANEVQILKQIYRDKGAYRGFYAGSLPNASVRMLKNVYRYPLMIWMPHFYETRFNFANQRVQKGLTGVSIAAIESMILCPFERVKTYLMTANPEMIREQQGLSWVAAFKAESQARGDSMFREMFRGYLPLFTRQCVAWVCFLTADSKMKSTLRGYLGLDQTERIPQAYIVPGSFVVAVCSTLAIMPFDSMKTHMQRENLTALSSRMAVQQVLSEVGVRGLFVGWRIRFAMYQLHALMTVDLLDRLETSFKKINKQSND